MKILSSGTAAFIMAATVSAFQEPPLPVWSIGEREGLKTSGWIPGSFILTDDAVTEEQGKTVIGPLRVERPKPEDVAEDLKSFPVIAEQDVVAYFAERPKAFLVDPQGLLSASDYRERLGFLNYHASDSSIDLFVYVMGGDQEIPGEVREEETIERFFSEGRPAAIVYYYMGSPQRSVIYLSPSITDTVSAVEQHRALESSMIQALEKANHSEQFEKFLAQMSIRIYWMERMLAGEPVATDLRQVAVVPVDAAGGGSEKSRNWTWLVRVTARFALPAGFILSAILMALGLSCWLRHRARYFFPEFEVEPRLGGAHAAGVGAVISFASASLPPASQRDQIPDYLRRA